MLLFRDSPVHPSRSALQLSSLVVLAALIIMIAGCDSNGGAPPTGALSVDVSASGDNIDTDGFTVTVDDSLSKEVATGGSATFSDVEEGSHQVALSGLQANCSVEGSNPQPITILEGDTSPVSFSVSCQSTTGAVNVKVATSGETLDQNGYILTVDGGDSTHVGTDSIATFNDLKQGDHEVAVNDVAVNCHVDGANPQSVSVAAMQSTRSSVHVTCKRAITKDIVFQSDRSGNDNIYAKDPVDFSPRQLTTGGASRPMVSPTGSRIAFAAQRNGNWEVHTIEADGSGLVHVAASASVEARDPAWSPDGTKIAFHRPGGILYTIHSDGSFFAGVSSDGATAPAWSPNGSPIAFHSTRDGNTDIYTITPGGGNLQQVTDTSANDRNPAWAPDGSRIVFESDRDGDFDIYTINPDGSDLKPVTDNSAPDRSPAWAPDGSRIAFHSTPTQGNSQGNTDIYTINPDGSEKERITDHVADDVNPSWTPLK